MPVLSAIPEESPDPDCPHCGGEGVPQSEAHRILAEDFSNEACPKCWSDEPEENPLDEECKRCGSVGGFGCYECTPENPV